MIKITFIVSFSICPLALHSGPDSGVYNLYKVGGPGLWGARTSGGPGPLGGPGLWGGVSLWGGLGLWGLGRPGPLEGEKVVRKMKKVVNKFKNRKLKKIKIKQSAIFERLGGAPVTKIN